MWLLRLSHVQLSATPWTVTHQALLSMGFSRQAYWSGLPFPLADLLDSGTEPASPALAGEFHITEPPGKPKEIPYLKQIRKSDNTMCFWLRCEATEILIHFPCTLSNTFPPAVKLCMTQDSNSCYIPPQKCMFICIKTAVPNLLGTRDRFGGRQFFHRWRKGTQDDSHKEHAISHMYRSQ